jgi:hypothetical protein
MGSEIVDLIRRARTLLAKGGTLESSGGVGAPIDDAALATALAKSLRASETGETDEALRKLTVRRVVDRGRAALHAVAGGTPPTNLGDEDVSALELIVHTTGRPAMRYRNTRVGMPPNELGDNARWTALVAAQRATIDDVSSRVGGITYHGYTGPVLATGWRVGADCVITNRHVAAELVTDRHAAPSEWKIDPAKAPYIDFAYTDKTSGPKRCNVTGLVYCRDDLDLAILRVVADNAPLPAEIPINRNKDALGRKLPSGDGAEVFQGAEIYTVGHPYRAVATEAIQTVFGQADGRKRWAPGFLTEFRPQESLLHHDASTLSGNSGSCVIATGSHAAIGLHFGGQAVDGTGRSGLGFTNHAIAFAHLDGHPVLQYLERGSR